MNSPHYIVGKKSKNLQALHQEYQKIQESCTPGSLVSKAWYSMYENEAKEELKSDEAKQKVVRQIAYHPTSSSSSDEKFKSQVVLRMGPIADVFPEALVTESVSDYIK